MNPSPSVVDRSLGAVRRLPLVLAAALVLALVTGMSPAHAKTVPIPEPHWVDYTRNIGEYRAQLAHRLNEVRVARGLGKIHFYDTCVQDMSQKWARDDAAAGAFGSLAPSAMRRKCKTPYVGGWGIAGERLSPKESVDYVVEHHPQEVFVRGAQRLGVGVAMAESGERYVIVSMTKKKKRS